MPKSKEVFICQNCGAASPKWQGQCPGCGEWNTFLAEVSSPNPRKSARLANPARADVSTTLAAEAHMEQPRLATGSAELDRVLGGGLVPGSVTLIGGDPGIGKSTLMLQAAAALNASGAVLYATGEESVKQVALRARRLGLEAATARLIAATCVEDIVGAATTLSAHVLSSTPSKPCIPIGWRLRPAPCRNCASARRNWCASRSRAEPRCCWWDTSPRKVKSQGRAFWNTWSTRCCTSKAIPAAVTGCCVR